MKFTRFIQKFKLVFVPNRIPKPSPEPEPDQTKDSDSIRDSFSYSSDDHFSNYSNEQHFNGRRSNAHSNGRHSNTHSNGRHSNAHSNGRPSNESRTHHQTNFLSPKFHWNGFNRLGSLNSKSSKTRRKRDLNRSSSAPHNITTGRIFGNRLPSISGLTHRLSISTQSNRRTFFPRRSNTTDTKPSNIKFRRNYNHSFRNMLDPIPSVWEFDSFFKLPSLIESPDTSPESSFVGSSAYSTGLPRRDSGLDNKHTRCYSTSVSFNETIDPDHQLRNTSDKIKARRRKPQFNHSHRSSSISTIPNSMTNDLLSTETLISPQSSNYPRFPAPSSSGYQPLTKEDLDLISAFPFNALTKLTHRDPSSPSRLPPVKVADPLPRPPQTRVIHPPLSQPKFLICEVESWEPPS